MDERQLERDSILNGSFAALTLNILSTFAPLLLLDALRGTRQQVALLSSLPSVVSLAAFIGAAVWLGRFQSQRGITVRAAAVARALVVALAVVPLFGATWGAWALVGLYALISLPGSLANVAWQGLIAGLVAPRRRAGFFAERNRITSLAGMGAVIVAGVVLQLFPPSQALPYQIAFLACGVFAIFELRFLARHPDVAPEPTAPLVTGWLQSLAVQPFRRYLIAAAIYTFAWQSAWPLYTIFQIQDAHATAIWLAMFSLASSATSILTYRWWGAQSTIRGITPLLLVSAIGLGVSPALTVALVSLPWIVLTNLITGVFIAGITLLMFNQLLGVVPEGQRVATISLYNLALGLMGALAPEFGILMLHLFTIRPAMVLLAALRVVTAGGFLIATGLPPGLRRLPRRRWQWVARTAQPTRPAVDRPGSTTSAGPS